MPRSDADLSRHAQSHSSPRLALRFKQRFLLSSDQSPNKQPHLLRSLSPWCRLMRFDKPIGIWLLLWPTLWAVFMASNGWPDLKILMIFIAGVIVMRAAGCVMNDLTDIRFDSHVSRTQNRPLVTNEISKRQARWLVIGLLSIALLIALLLVFMFDYHIMWLAPVGLFLTLIYPFVKRATHFPQVVLGIAFASSIPMAFIAITHAFPPKAWLLCLITVLWTVAYDTQYAMVDRQDDIAIGVKSTALYFGDNDRIWIGGLQIAVLTLLIVMGFSLHYSMVYFAAVGLGAVLFAYQQRLIAKRIPAQCFKAFLNNHWFGCVIFLGILAAMLIDP